MITVLEKLIIDADLRRITQLANWSSQSGSQAIELEICWVKGCGAVQKCIFPQLFLQERDGIIDDVCWIVCLGHIGIPDETS